uniref:Beta-2-microglobulin n=1 Tax=Gadus morhua TaxID=8049 RepID=A0A8C5BQV9_GADMO
MNPLMVSVFCGLVLMSMAITPPKVQVYTREPAEPGTGNSLICYLNNFQPPEVEVDLLENGVVIPGAVQSDLMFESQWQYHLTKRVPFIPREGARYACRVNHMGRTTNHAWGDFGLTLYPKGF